MSSAVNHRARSHRSEHLKATAFGGFKPAISPNRNKYATQTKLARGISKLAALFKKSAAKSKARAKRESSKKEAAGYD